ncbi:MAG: cyclic pyranopterin monophosphate synthase MoaC, partial [Bacteriovoracaceae bacterium]|nr:cyclic pyranopterin monophosphate synthase MoaC [Bacteriovoracaceae bacterium]
VFNTAIIAGTMGLKQTSQLIPFCHQINIEGSKIDIELQGEHAVITCEARTFGKTGVEMEALTGAQIAALTIYDMCKSIDNTMRIESCSLLSKKGGKSDFNLKGS